MLIPFIASRLVRGEVGSTVFALVSAAGFYANTAAKTSSLLASRSILPPVLPKPCPDSGPPTGGGPGRLAAPRRALTERAAGYWLNQDLQHPQAQAWQPVRGHCGGRRSGPSRLCAE